MKKILQWLGIILGGLAAIILLVIMAAMVNTNDRMNRTYDAPQVTITIPTDKASIEMGEHFATIRGCLSCHGENLGGTLLFDVGPIGTIYSDNLTEGENGVASTYTDAEIARAIRYGVRPDGTSVLVMPSNEMTGISDEELGQLIAFIRSVPPVDTEPVTQRFAPLGRVLVMFNALPSATAEIVDFDTVAPASMPPAVTAEYGEYIAISCIGCHNPAYSGGPLPGAQEGDPLARNLTPGGSLAAWSLEQFKTALRTGATPSGYVLNNEFMPWGIYSEMTDTEVEAIWQFLQSLPAREFGEQ
ncbi:MAG: cytochrome c [Anaerolineae bacterium]|nr:MAG: cytochrome c [Anaerolineae bacterium]